MVTQIVDTVTQKLTCLDDRLAAIQRLLSYEYGQPIREVHGHDPRRLPFVGRVQLGANASQEIDFIVLLAKPATRGHITNLGTNPATLHFIAVNPTAGANVASGPYVLPAATTLDISFFVDALRITAGANPADVQYLVQ